jgi:hypothetical protein
MELLTKEIRDMFPPLYACEEKEPHEIEIVVKYFTPDSNWTWWAYEFDGTDTFFGLVEGFEVESGYFSLSELQSVRGPLGLPIERDLHYEGKTLADVLKEINSKEDTE